jgi:hypothetical protein
MKAENPTSTMLNLVYTTSGGYYNQVLIATYQSKQN